MRHGFRRTSGRRGYGRQALRVTLLALLSVLMLPVAAAAQEVDPNAGAFDPNAGAFDPNGGNQGDLNQGGGNVDDVARPTPVAALRVESHVPSIAVRPTSALIGGRSGTDRWIASTVFARGFEVQPLSEEEGI